MKRGVIALVVFWGLSSCLVAQNGKTTNDAIKKQETVKEVKPPVVDTEKDVKQTELNQSGKQQVRKKQVFVIDESKDQKAKKTAADLKAEGVRQLKSMESNRTKQNASGAKTTTVPKKE